MNAKKLIQSIQDKDMDRKDFLKYTGMVVLGIVGTKTALGLILPDIPEQKSAPKGFGSSKYGA